MLIWENELFTKYPLKLTRIANKKLNEDIVRSFGKPRNVEMEWLTIIKNLQKYKRSDRLNVDDIATIIWIIPINTQAEQWMNKSIKNISKEDIQYFTDINELITQLWQKKN